VGVSKFKAVSFSTACIMAVAPAYADSNWAVAGEYGQTPNRSMVMVDIGSAKVDETRGEYGPGGQPYLPGPKKKSINPTVDAAEAQLAAVLGKTTGPFISITLVIVHESANAPDFSTMTIRNFCDRKINDISWPLTYWRDHNKSTEQSAIVFPSKDEVMTKVLNLTCGDTSKAYLEGGFKAVTGEFKTNPYPIAYPWKTAWAGATRPTYRVLSPEEKAARRAENDAIAAKARATLDGALASTEATARGLKSKLDVDDAFWKDQAQRRKYRQKSKLNAPLEAWLKKDEEYLVQQLGMPDKAYNAGNTRILFYDSRGNWSQVFTTTDVNGNVVNQSQNDYYCNLTLELRNNQMIDFKVVGNSCDYGEFRR
jgi:hypothetical protein